MLPTFAFEFLTAVSLFHSSSGAVFRISKIPLLGNILVGKKVGEGIFGVSFKIKGPPKKLKTTVNPIKTLTPRFITRTVEKLKKD